MSFKLFGRKKQDDGGVDQESQLRNNPKDVDAADEEEDVEQEYNGSANEDDDIKLANPKGPSLFLQPRRASFFERLVRAKSPESKSSLSSEASLSLPPLPPVNLLGYKPLTKHRLLDQELAENIRLLATPRNQLYEDWELVYSLEQHGISLKTLYRNCDPEYQLEKLRNTTKQTGYADSVVRAATSHHHHGHGGDVRRHHSYVIVIKDEKNNKFGCYLNEHLRAVEEQRWYGNGECFLWKCEKYDPQLLNHSISQGEETEPTQDDANEQTRVPQVSTRFKAFVHTNLNSNIIYSNNECISIGSSNGRNGLWIDKSMYHGVSYPCDTFGNEILNGTGNLKFGKFKIMGLEVWRIGALVDRS